MNNQLQAIIETTKPTFIANIRHLSRKEWAQNVRKLIKSIGLLGISVTTQNYSMAQTILIVVPDMIVDDNEHRKLHDSLWFDNHGSGECPDCAQRHQAREQLKAIILSAFPDLDDRSDTQSDYFDYCLSFE